MVTKHHLTTFLRAQEHGVEPMNGDIETLSDLSGLTTQKIKEIRENAKVLISGYLTEVEAAAERDPDKKVLQEELSLFSEWKLRIQ